MKPTTTEIAVLHEVSVHCRFHRGAELDEIVEIMDKNRGLGLLQTVATLSSLTQRRWLLVLPCKEWTPADDRQPAKKHTCYYMLSDWGECILKTTSKCLF